MESAIGDTLKHALFLARHLNTCDIQCVTVAMLLDLGIPTKRIGFDYLINAILLFCDDPAQMLTKEIYPAVGRLYDTGVGAWQIERAIRTAITEAWDSRNPRVWHYYFPQCEDGAEKPTNAEFISGVGRFLELWKGCCKEVADERK